MSRASKNKITVQNSMTMCTYLTNTRGLTITEISKRTEYSRDFICKLRGKNPPEKVELAFFLGLIETCGIPYHLAMKDNLTVKDITNCVSKG